MATTLFDHEKQTKELVSLISSTLHSLAADAAAVRQASCLLEAVGVDCVEDDQEEKSAAKSVDKDLLQKFVGLDEIVTGLEEKVSALKQMVHEEKLALVNFEGDLKKEADEQAYFVEQLVEAMEQANVGVGKSNISLDASASFDSDLSVESTSLLHQSVGRSRRDSVDPRRKSDRPRKHSGAAPEGDENRDPSQFCLPRITHEELDNYRAKHTVMGPRMLSLVNLNEALEEIENLCKNQLESSLALRSKQQKQSHLSSGSLQRRYDYLQKRQQRASLSANERTPDGHSSTWSADSSVLSQEPVSVTEQQLREKCAFFRHGESTARTTLSALCGLRRLKQVPSKRREVTYLCLSHDVW